MKVKELIKHLKKCNPEAIIKTSYSDESEDTIYEELNQIITTCQHEEDGGVIYLEQ